MSICCLLNEKLLPYDPTDGHIVTTDKQISYTDAYRYDMNIYKVRYNEYIKPIASIMAIDEEHKVYFVSKSRDITGAPKQVALLSSWFWKGTFLSPTPCSDRGRWP